MANDVRESITDAEVAEILRRREEKKNKPPAVRLEDIKPGNTAEENARIKAAILEHWHH